MIVALNLDRHINYVERIISDKMEKPKGLVFIKHLRFPLTKGEAARKYGNKLKHVVTKAPTMPYNGALLLKGLLEQICINNSSCSKLYYSNPLLDVVRPVYSYSYPIALEDIVENFVEGLNEYEIEIIINHAFRAYEEIKKYIETLKDHVYVFNFEKRIVILTIDTHIKALRFDEFMEDKELEKAMEEETIDVTYWRWWWNKCNILHT